MVIASYTGKNHPSAFPSYEMINRQTQAMDEIIKDTIDLLKSIGVLDYKNRADILTGHLSLT